MGCSASGSCSSSPKTVERASRVQCDSVHPLSRTSKGRHCGSLAPANSTGSCSSTVSTNAGAASSLRSGQSAGAQSSFRSGLSAGRTSTTLSSSSGEERFPADLGLPSGGRFGLPAPSTQARPQQGRDRDRDERSQDAADRYMFKTASSMRPVPWLGPITDSTMMERRRTKSKESKEPATPSTTSGETPSTSRADVRSATWGGRSADEALELQLGGGEPSCLEEGRVHAQMAFASDF